MLTSIESQGGKIDDSSDEAIIELYSSVKSSQPIINKMIEQSSDHDDNEEDVNKLLALNESANNVINKFQLLKGGNVSEASKIKTGSASQELNLIDFDDAPEDVSASKEQGYTDLLSDLSNLTFQRIIMQPLLPAVPMLIPLIYMVLVVQFLRWRI